MTSIKRLRSVIQSTAHHAVSGLCYVHPHLGKACKEIGIQTISVNLLKLGFEPSLLKLTKELELSTTALRSKFYEILNIENINVAKIEKAYALFNFYKDNWPSSCYIEIITQEGKKLDVAVDSLGNKTEVLRRHR